MYDTRKKVSGLYVRNSDRYRMQYQTVLHDANQLGGVAIFFRRLSTERFEQTSIEYFLR